MENQPKTSPPAQANFSPHNAIQTSPIVRENRRSGNTGCALRGPPLTLVVRTFRWRVFFSFFSPPVHVPPRGSSRTTSGTRTTVWEPLI